MTYSKSFLTGILFAVLAGCSPVDDENFNETYARKVKEEIQKGEGEISTFLTFDFGITQDEYVSRLRKLYEEGKLSAEITYESYSKFRYTVDTTYTYLFPLNGVTVNSLLVPVFRENSLSELRVKIPAISLNDSDGAYEALRKLYKRKYGDDFLVQSRLYGMNNYYWISKNQQIKISSDITSFNITYTDLSKMNFEDESPETDQESIISDI